ncbi:hypothetical protein LSCM1_03810 [Leishmania martiniquensis]|uniref:Uncharacterized protein n=1 Tax=Leishmania martiniquensis TaxID=1580590 RepID=A0A836GCI2_9TRYP|nr:hypothetical protein LSCM1_03810 [Leishmania martiniquensis]
MQLMQSLSKRKRQVRFSRLTPSTELPSFDVLEWIPGSGVPLAGRHAKHAASAHRPDDRRSMCSNEGPTHLSDHNAFDASLGSWRCLRTLSLRGDILTLEDAESVDMGTARQHEFTWQQGPGGLPPGGAPSDCTDARVGLCLAPVSASEGATDMGAEMALRDALLGNLPNEGSPHGLQRRKQEIPLQEICSIRRHCFEKPLPVLFDARGQLVSEGSDDDTAACGDRATRRISQRRHCRGDTMEMKPNLQWRYELWGPVGVIFTLQGGRRMFLAFASAQHVEQIERLLMRFTTGAALNCPQQHCGFSQPSLTDASAAASKVPSASAGSSVPSTASVHGPLSSRLTPTVVQGSPSQCRSPARKASWGAYVRATSATRFSSRANTASPMVCAFASDALVTSTPLEPHQQTALWASERLPTRPFAAVTAPQTVWAASPAGARRDSGKPPGSGYLYCRLWGEASQYRRYYFKPCTAAGMSHVVHLSRHRLRLWQRLQRFFGSGKRSVSLDLRLISVSPSAVHENVLCLTCPVVSSAESRSLESPGRGVALAGRVTESVAPRGARRRELELPTACRVHLEALARSPEERTMWLAWFRSRGVTVQPPVDGAQVGDEAGGERALEISATLEPFRSAKPLPTSPVSGPGQETVHSNPVDLSVEVVVTPLCSEPSPSLKPLAISSPYLPLKEQLEGRRVETPVTLKMAAVPGRSSPWALNPSKGSPSLSKPLSTAGKGVGKEPHMAWSPAVASGQDDREEEEELTVVVDDDASVSSTQRSEAVELHSPLLMVRSDPSKPARAETPPCHTQASPLLTEAARRQGSRGGGAAEAPNLFASAEEVLTIDHAVARTGRTLAAPIAAPMYLEDTTSSRASGLERSNEMQSPVMTVNSPQAFSHSAMAPTSWGGIRGHGPSQEGKAPLATGEAPLCRTAVAQQAIGMPLPETEGKSSEPDALEATTDGDVASAALKASRTAVRLACASTAPKVDRSSSSNSIGTPPRTAEPETAAAQSVALEPLVAVPSQQIWPAPGIKVCPPLGTPPKRMQGMTGSRVCGGDPASGVHYEVHAIREASALSSPASSSPEKPDKVDGGTDDAQFSDASLSLSVRDSGLLTSWRSAVDPRLMQFLEPYVDETGGDQASNRCDSGHRVGDSPMEAASTPFDLHVVPSRDYHDVCAT